MPDQPAQIADHGATGVSRQWATLCETVFGNVDGDFLSAFRAPDHPANRFSTWRPKEPTYRYYLTLIFNEARIKSAEFFSNYAKLGETTLGQPLCVRVRGLDINLDYLTALEEYDFLIGNSDLHAVRSVVEVGAGYGRTAHTLLKLCPAIESYMIIDLEPILGLARAYLGRVMPEYMPKVQFVVADSARAWQDRQADLAINIDSFQEMPHATIDAYMKGLFAKAKLAYLKNPVCKYSPDLLGIERPVLQDAFDSGYMTEVANIYDEDELEKMRRIFESRYRPTEGHRVKARGPSGLFAHYQHILYGPEAHSGGEGARTT